MTEEEYLHNLLYRAFVDIRVASLSQEYYTCFALADVFHNVPLAMIRADQEQIPYAEIIMGIKEKCITRKCMSWFENASANILDQAK